MNHISSLIKHIHIIIALSAIALVPGRASAFALDCYADTSVLESGKWVKVGVKESGLHFISNATLRSWGFQNPSEVKIHGYGGLQISDRLLRVNYIDDLPPVQTLATDKGVYFYAVGVDTWNVVDTRNRYYVRTLNPYSERGFYYVTSNPGTRPDIPVQGYAVVSVSPQTSFVDCLAHELEQTSLSESGNNLLGEDFRMKRSQTFNFSLPGRVEDSNVWLRCTFAVKSTSSSSVTLTANGSLIPGSNTIAALTDSKNYMYMYETFSRTFNIEGEKLAVGITHVPAGTVSAAHLDALNINYTRRIALTDGHIEFECGNSSVRLEGADRNTHVWDITDPLSISALDFVVNSDGAHWTSHYSGKRRYVAWNENRSYPAPEFVGTVANQNLHGIGTTPDMVIVTPKEWISEARRLADFHSGMPDTLKVEVVLLDEVFNEFSSGTRDPGALRKLFKMLYDRGNTAGRPLRYALLMGRPTFDNRRLTPSMRNYTAPTIPSWQTFHADNVHVSYATDDVMAMLEDNSGNNLITSRLSIALGRAPVSSLAQAKTFVDKVIAYANPTAKQNTEWKNQVLLVADDGDKGLFIQHCEDQWSAMLDTDMGKNMFYTKAYTDAFPLQGGTCVGARDRIHRMLGNGLLWMTYVGHGNSTSLSDQNIFSKKDIDELSNRNLPVLFAVTCSFGRCDAPSVSGAENMLLNPSGGAIAVISPTREAYITSNGILAAAMGDEVFRTDAAGRMGTIGDIYKNAKNNNRNSSTNDDTKRRYMLLGDPALRMASPSAQLRLETVSGVDISEDLDESEWPEIKARQNAILEGSVYDSNGNLMSDFTGLMSATLYDAEYSTTSSGRNAHNTEGKAMVFQEQGSKLYSGRDSVVNGRFRICVPMPVEVADNFSPAAFNMYARANDGRESIGCSRQLYVFGYDDSAEPDNIAPSIDYAYLNHESYTDGSTVNEQPMFIARVSDDTGINLSSAGIGHQMSLKLDNNRSFSDISFYYTPSSDGTPSGTIAYPMSEMTEGNHTLTFRVWDTSGNSATRTLEFFVERGALAKVFDIYTDANPASTEANFYISHNRPDAPISVRIDIYNMLGHRVWTTTVTDRSDLFLSAPIKWNLCTSGGQRVNRGIYIYRATVTIDGREITSQAKRIAVTGH